MWSPHLQTTLRMLNTFSGSHAPGIVHTAVSKSTSDQRAKRSSLERMKTNKVSSTASRVNNLPE